TRRPNGRAGGRARGPLGRNGRRERRPLQATAMSRRSGPLLRVLIGAGGSHRRHLGNYFFPFLPAALAAFFGSAFLAAFFLAAFGAGFSAAGAALFLPPPLPKTLSQFLLNCGLGPERTIGPDMRKAPSRFATRDLE